MGSSLLPNEVGMLSDADGLLKALAHAAYFKQLPTDKDRVVARAAEIAFS